MAYLKEDLFSDIEGRDININISTENSNMSYLYKHVYIDNDGVLLSNNDELVIDWRKANIEKEDDRYIIRLPEITYEVEYGYC